MKWQYRILELFDAMLYPFEFPDGFRAAAELRGFRFGRGRQPQTSAQRSDRTALTSVLQCILADFELVDPPASGCAPRIAADRHGQGGTGGFRSACMSSRSGVSSDRSAGADRDRRLVAGHGGARRHGEMRRRAGARDRAQRQPGRVHEAVRAARATSSMPRAPPRQPPRAMRTSRARARDSRPLGACARRLRGPARNSVPSSNRQPSKDRRTI